MANQGAKTLPARYFTDPARYTRELESFYFKRWIAAGRSGQIPAAGDYFLRDLGDESVIVVRQQDESIRAFYNVCRHRGTRLCTESSGRFERRIQCPYHGWTYLLNGSLSGAPHMDASFCFEDYPLKALHAEVWDGHIFLNFAKKPPALARQLGGLPARFRNWRMQDLRLAHRIVYQVRANWKLLIANYNECLHCPVLHPALNRLTNYLGADNQKPSRNAIGGSMGFKRGVETMTVSGQRRRAYLPGLTAGEQARVEYWAIYPNLFLSLHPDYMMTHTLWPKAVDHTEVICEFHFQPGETEFSDAVEFWDLTNREDWKIVEQSQAGIRSRAYQPGPYSPREELLWAFDREIRKLH